MVAINKDILARADAITRTCAAAPELISALDLTLSPEHEARLTEVSAPRLNFPAANNAALARLAQNGGTTVDGVPTPSPPRLILGGRVY